MAAEVAGLVLFPTPIFLFNLAQNPGFTAERAWFLTYYMLINNLTDHERWNAKLSLVVKLGGQT